MSNYKCFFFSFGTFTIFWYIVNNNNTIIFIFFSAELSSRGGAGERDEQQCSGTTIVRKASFQGVSVT